MEDVINFNGKKPDDVVEDQATDNFLGLALYWMVRQWCGDTDKSLPYDRAFVDKTKAVYEELMRDCDKDFAEYILSVTDSMQKMKDGFREVVLKIKDELEEEEC